MRADRRIAQSRSRVVPDPSPARFARSRPLAVTHLLDRHAVRRGGPVPPAGGRGPHAAPLIYNRPGGPGEVLLGNAVGRRGARAELDAHASPGCTTTGQGRPAG